jgi:Flp pilus assembly protein protease CpaA
VTTLLAMHFELFALIACLWWSAVIAYTDLRTFRITNSSLVIGLVLIWPSLFLLDQKFQITPDFFLISVAALMTGLVSFLGMGDVKLILFIAPWLHYQNMSKTLVLLIAVAWLQLMVVSLMHRGFPKRIAFAPAILLAAALNMAT